MIRIISVGKMKDKHLKAVQDDYLTRISKFTKIELIELKEANPSFEESKIIEDETARLLATLKEDEFVVVFDVKGQSMDSIEYSQLVEKSTNITCVIGGSLGFDERLRNRAQVRISLSKMTFPHLFARVVVLEQIYRSYKIINNQKYHK